VQEENNNLKEQSEKNCRKGKRKGKEPNERGKDTPNIRKRNGIVYIKVSSLNQLVGKRNISEV
jgi:hypothetical protein